MLPDFRSNSDIEQRTDLGNKFLELKLKYLAAGDDNIIPDPKLDKENSIQH
jgi:hypothetical protein